MFRFCAVTDRKLLGGKWQRKIINVVRDAIVGGIDAVQVREKDLSSRELFELAMDLRKITKNKALLYINDRIDIALAVKADGVHLGANSMHISYARKLFRGLIGVSCHSVKDVLEAEKNKADYVFLGPIYYTPSKSKYGKPLGIDVLKEVRKKIKIKIIAIGGINETNVKECINAGADGVAVISSIFASDNPKESAKEIRDCFTHVARSQ